ncbi:MAG TPA: D-hexose-6-phosphate mutarotase, partial [Giesbergeria sp.]|nr:D-hexose-6-phosphate mutarotase [Giesbergeria sp.]
MLPKARSEVETYCGQPCIRLAIGDGDSALVALHGAQVLSWISGGRERLYLSPKAVFDGQAAIRGGIPLCFPQFNQRGPLPKHGFARNLAWRADGAQAGEGVTRLSLHLT